MKIHYLFYAAAMLSVAGMWLDWHWVKGTFDGWFPMFAVVAGQLTRLRTGAPETILDRAFKSQRAEKMALASLVLIGLGITAWALLLIYVYHPMKDAESIEQYKKDHAAYILRKNAE